MDDQVVTGTGIAPGPQSLLSPLAEDRLDRLAESVRGWDWRTAPVEIGETSTVLPVPDTTAGLPTGRTAPSAPPRAVAHPRRRRGRRRTVVPVVVAVVAVAGTVSAYLLGSGGTGPAALPPSTVTTLADYGLRAQFVDVSKAMYIANAGLTSSLAAPGGRTSVSQVRTEMVPYATAVRNYQFELHFLPWPNSMDASATDLGGQLNSFYQFLDTVSSVDTPAQLTAWLSRFRDQSALTQIADNRVRAQLGLPDTAIFP